MTKRYEVIKPDGTPEEVGADDVSTIGGVLEFYIDGKWALAYNPNNWKYVELSYDEDAE